MYSPTSSVVSLADDVEIRILTSADINQIRDLHASLLNVDYKPQFFRQLILNSTRLCLVAHPIDDPKSLIGFVSASIHASTLDLSRSAQPDGGLNVQVLTLGVLPAYQQNGLARRLVHAVVRELRRTVKHSIVLSRPKACPHSVAGTLVRTQIPCDFVGAQKFYSSLGLAVGGEIRDAYRTPASRDAYMLEGMIL